jgi:hypothetical protein
MFTPKKCIESFKSYRKGDKDFCKLASISDQDDDYNKSLGFWFEVLRNDNILVFSVRFESFTRGTPIKLKFFGKQRLEEFIEEARQYISEELEKMLCSEVTEHAA